VDVPTVSVHVISQANASLLDRVDDDVFDHEVRPELLRAFLASESNLLVVAVVQAEVDHFTWQMRTFRYLLPPALAGPVTLLVGGVARAGATYRDRRHHRGRSAQCGRTLHANGP